MRELPTLPRITGERTNTGCQEGHLSKQNREAEAGIRSYLGEVLVGKFAKGWAVNFGNLEI